MRNYYMLETPVKRLVFLAVILTFFVRPFALGLDNSLLTNALLLFVASLVALNTPATLYNRKKVLAVILLLYLVYAIYEGLRGSFEKSFFPVLQVITVFLLFRNYAVMKLYFKYLKNFFLVLIILAIINAVLVIIYGDKEILALIKDIQYLKGTYEFTLYFPLTWSRMGWTVEGNLFSTIQARQYFFFVEPGMAPPFFTGLIYILWNDKDEKYKWLQTIIFIIGIFLSFSTGGPLILLLSLSVWYYFSKKGKMSPLTIGLFALGIYLAWYAYNYMPYFGRQVKMELSAGTQTSIETHETFGEYILFGVSLIVIMGIISLKIKYNKVLPIVMAAIIALGYMSNYIGFTTLATIFLFWDSQPLPGRNSIIFEKKSESQLESKLLSDGTK